MGFSIFYNSPIVLAEFTLKFDPENLESSHLGINGSRGVQLGREDANQMYRIPFIVRDLKSVPLQSHPHLIRSLAEALLSALLSFVSNN